MQYKFATDQYKSENNSHIVRPADPKLPKYYS